MSYHKDQHAVFSLPLLLPALLAHLLYHSPYRLLLEPSLLRPFRRLCLSPGPGPVRGLCYELDKLIESVLPVLLAAPGIARSYDYLTLACEPLPGKGLKPCLDIRRKTRRSVDIKPQLDGCRSLVYMLSAGAGGPYELLLDL